ncbi:MAG: IMP dehydrogenase, partial [Bacteroidota bacterium]
MTSKKIIGEAITYDDVLLVPAKSSVLPRETRVETRLTRRITLNIPLLSAAMDTVTESEMAIALAREGGMGILHKNMTIERQAGEVDRVKRSESGMIRDPITLTPDRSVREALDAMKKYSISGIPIVEEEKLVGILTNRDLRFEPNLDLEVGRVMTTANLITAPAGTTLEEAEAILQKNRIEKLPVVDRNGRLKGLITFKDIQKKKRHPNACKDTHGRLRVGAAVGVASDTLERVDSLVKAGVDVVVIDTAHGHSRGVIDMIRRVRAKIDIDLIAGNVGTGEATRDLIRAGVDAVKVGIGPGS